jgi:hypothetical protein
MPFDPDEHVRLHRTLKARTVQNGQSGYDPRAKGCTVMDFAAI